MNAACISADSLDFMGRTMIAFKSYIYARNIYWLPLYDRIGNFPVRSVYIVRSFASANVGKQNTSHFSVVSCVGVVSVSGLCCIGVLSFLVDLTFLGILCIWPLTVADDGGRYFVTASFVRPGIPNN